MGETIFVNRGTSVFNVEVSPDVLDRLVRTALRRPEGRGPVGRLLGNAPPAPAESSERTAARRRETLVRWIADELRRWSKSGSPRAGRHSARRFPPPQGTSDSFPAN